MSIFNAKKQTLSPQKSTKTRLVCLLSFILGLVAFINEPSSRPSRMLRKVHRSLARAKKLKGQTPKVDKQEDKKKQPLKRVKKPIQYNRRPERDKKVGANSNADNMP
mmetsp:Transcript_37730/g.43094  ORF Transcript_37730/g.43094 Transcript_37730/m.43094 type:complete len:107 (+) Transcript_37730:216-536(+)|eukprot:CAMPEP_0194188912 /NCGR_PEP_ID=MMETSP0154-20130528/56885_1 /TAXON_ID=1049557 /ORGANISM="Thalassiothrix antarctica, Strain L6-D1" /LENGTH=106 /DNA_ID=CAMNT_0038909713 /DNA_START=191 /DNA_END=511 /DNA_ORIENTATION=+